jgi:hypothetical protein
MLWWIAVCSDLCGVCLVIGVVSFSLEGMGSAMVFSVGDVSTLLHFSLMVPFWIRGIVSHCNGWI